MTAQEIATIVVSKLFATVGKEMEKTRLAVPAKKLASAALISSSQLTRKTAGASPPADSAIVVDNSSLKSFVLFTNVSPPAGCKTAKHLPRGRQESLLFH